MKFLGALLLFLMMFGEATRAADWPDGPWINGAPRESATISAIVFVSPLDLQFQHMMHVWRKLEKKYGTLNVDFLIVAMQEPLFPFSEGLVREVVKESNYPLPVLVDSGSRYSRLWRAYVSPTVNLVLRNGKVTPFDPGNFDPLNFEKSLQKLLKETGTGNPPPREYIQDLDLKGCHPHTLMASSKFQKAWSSLSPNFEGPWNLDGSWAEKSTRESGQMEVTVSKSQVGVIAESQPGPSHVLLFMDGQKIPAEIRGRDVQEDKAGNTYINFSSPKMYEVVSHGNRLKENSSKLTFNMEGKGIKIWAVETLPACMEF